MSFIRKLSICFFAFLIFVSSMFVAVPVLAASSTPDTFTFNGTVYNFPELPSADSQFIVIQRSFDNQPYLYFIPGGLISVHFDTTVSELTFTSSVEDFVSPYLYSDGSWIESTGVVGFPLNLVVDPSGSSAMSLIFGADQSVVDSSALPYVSFITADSSEPDPDPEPDPEPVPVGDGIYYKAYDLFLRHIYGVDSSELTSDQALTLTGVSTIAALFLVSLPFLLVFALIKLFR